MRRLRVMSLMDETLVPPDSIEGLTDEQMLDWKSEYDVVTTLRELGHEVAKVGVSNDVDAIAKAVREFKPHIAFNLLEEFHGVAVYDYYIASYLELLKLPYTGCNPRGLMLAHDKGLCKQILTFHDIQTPPFRVYERGHKVLPPDDLHYPLFVKSSVEDASYGLTRRSMVDHPEALVERVKYFHEEIKTDALVEEFIEGREFYVGVLGNERLLTLPIWELVFTSLPENEPNIATVDVKWDFDHQKALGVKTEEARDLPPRTVRKIKRICCEVYRALSMSGYARMDLRMRPDGEIFVLEANPNPNLSYGEDLAESADVAGIRYEQLLQKILSLGLRYRAPWRL